MKHAIVGAGGVGGLVAAALAKVGEEVTLILRPSTYERFPAELHLESTFGNFDVPVSRATKLDGHFDLVWLTVKATQLDDALQTISEGADSFDYIVPLLNGVDHVDRLRALYGDSRVIPATIAVESERVAPGHVVRRSPFVRLAVAESGRREMEGVLKKLADFGFTCEFVADEKTLLWSKLVFLAPFALATSASGLTAGQLRGDDQWREKWFAAVREACAVAAAEGATVSAAPTISMSESLPDPMTSSMAKDLKAGNTPELDAIGESIVREGIKHRIPTPIVEELIAAIKGRISPR